MLHLLTETSLFISLPNGCFCQMTGEPLVHFKVPIGLSTPNSAQVDNKRKRGAADDASERPAKRPKLDIQRRKPTITASLLSDR